MTTCGGWTSADEPSRPHLFHDVAGMDVFKLKISRLCRRGGLTVALASLFIIFKINCPDEDYKQMLSLFMFIIFVLQDNCRFAAAQMTLATHIPFTCDCSPHQVASSHPNAADCQFIVHQLARCKKTDAQSGMMRLHFGNQT